MRSETVTTPENEAQRTADEALVSPLLLRGRGVGNGLPGGAATRTPCVAVCRVHSVHTERQRERERERERESERERELVALPG